jgi:hypothetical protein
LVARELLRRETFDEVALRDVSLDHGVDDPCDGVTGREGAEA